jgi:uncharacterized membrane protein
MLIHREPLRRNDAIFAVVILCASIALLFVPSRFHDTNQPRTLQARARILEVDNSAIQTFGLVRQGEQDAVVKILSGRFKGQELPAVNTLLGRMDIDKVFDPGDVALVGIDLDRKRDEIVSVNLIDHYRIHVELVLFGLFCLLLVGYAGWTGLKALVSFVFTAVMIWKALLPLFLLGWNPVVVSLAIVTVLSGVIIFLVGGLEKKGVVAFLGALSGIALTCVFSLTFGTGFQIHGAVKPFSETLLYSGFAHLNLARIFLAGVFLASSGAVMDIAMDISASMKEVHDRHPSIELADLIKSGFNVGRAVIGTMTTTLLLAYSGGYMTMLMVFLAQGTPMVNVFNLNYVSSEILHTLVGSFGLVLVAPLTAVIGGLIYSRTEPAEPSDDVEATAPRVSAAAARAGDANLQERE